MSPRWTWATDGSSRLVDEVCGSVCTPSTLQAEGTRASLEPVLSERSGNLVAVVGDQNAYEVVELVHERLGPEVGSRDLIAVAREILGLHDGHFRAAGEEVPAG